jgi:uncharacterized protein (TIGR00730 family)
MTPLPIARPKPSVDDEQAPARIERLLRSPAYKRADDDLDLLQRDDLRQVRLGLEYLKPELAFELQRVRSTVALFGGSRVPDPAEAKRMLDGDELAKQPQVAKRLSRYSRYYEMAREFTRMISTLDTVGADGHDFVVVTGGGPGIMEAGNRGAFDAGRPSIGLNITLPTEQYPNPYITPELCFQFRYFALRKMHFLKRARALIAFPGGIGTLDEVFDALCLVQTRKIEPIPIVLVGREFWTRTFDLEFLATEGMIDREDLDLVCYAESAQEICDIITGWYGAPSNGTPGNPDI